jgi:four helix bundle protein
MKETPHRKLLAWQKGMKLCVAIFTTTKVFPREEMYGVASQMRRAALSVSSNLAEGAARSSKREFLHFLSNAEGSLSGLDTQIEACLRVDYLAPPQASSINSLECSALIRGLKHSLSDSS